MASTTTDRVSSVAEPSPSTVPEGPGDLTPQAPTDPDVTSRLIRLMPLRCQVVYRSVQWANRPGDRAAGQLWWGSWILSQENAGSLVPNIPTSRVFGEFSLDRKLKIHTGHLG